jgi:23S rRNA pseudouridine955/2504/2580 synthase
VAVIEQKIVTAEETGMRLDRWFKLHYPGLSFGVLQKLMRTGQVRIDGARVKTDARVEPGQTVRIPPLKLEGDDNRPLTVATMRDRTDFDALRAMILHEDEKLYVFNKPAGIAVQGGSGINRHIDGMLEALRSPRGEKPRLVHRLDRDTSGVLIVAKTRSAAVHLTKAFRERTTDKVYWALVKGVPRKKEDRISTYLRREATDDGDKMRIAKHGDEGAEHALTFTRVIAPAGTAATWLEMKPETGRMHQLRVHAWSIGHPILGDPKYPIDDINWVFPGGVQQKLHLHARRIRVPHPAGGILDITAPLPPHMKQTWNLFGWDEAEGDQDL